MKLKQIRKDTLRLEDAAEKRIKREMSRLVSTGYIRRRPAYVLQTYEIYMALRVGKSAPRVHGGVRRRAIIIIVATLIPSRQGVYRAAASLNILDFSSEDRESRMRHYVPAAYAHVRGECCINDDALA